MFKLFDLFNKGAYYTKLSRKEYVRVALLIILFIAVMVLCALELKEFSNIFNASRLVWTSLSVGLLLGVGLSYYFIKDKKDMELLTRFQLCLAIIFALLILMPPLASFTNRKLSFAIRREVPVTFIKAEGYYADRYGLLNQKKPDGYFIFFLKDGQPERIKTKQNPFPNAAEGEQVGLPVRRGLWGFEYVDL